MIDKMIRCKDLQALDHVQSLNEWFVKCPPTGKDKQWKDGRSAKETAKHWVYTIPQPFKDMLKPFKLTYKLCSPEFVTGFDKNGGNGRNHDLLILAENEKKKSVIISVESKVDEPFDKSISDAILEGEDTLFKTPNSKKLPRIKELRKVLFGTENENQLGLKYQLLTAVAGVLAEAKKQKSETAILLIQTFISNEVDKRKYSKNKDDLNALINLLSQGIYNNLDNNVIIGPLRIPNKTDLISNEINLFIGKYEIEI
jgi:hypothetical protein